MEQVGRRADPSRIDQLIDQPLAQSLDVQRPATREMQQRLLALGRAYEPAGAARNSLLLETLDGRPAHRAAGRHSERVRPGRTALQDHADHLRDHVAGTAHDHGVAHADIAAGHFLLVVQGRVRHGHAPDRDRGQARHGRQCSGASDLHLDVQHLRQGLLGREFVRKRKARRARYEPKCTLRLDRIDLVDHAVDVVRQIGTPLACTPVKGQQTVDAFHGGPLFGYRYPQGLQPVQQGGLAFRLRRTDQLADSVREKVQAPPRGNARIELPQAARGGVAGIGEFLLAAVALRAVQALKVALVHQHFPPHLDYRGPAVLQAQRYAVDRAHVGGDVFSHHAVASCGRKVQHPVQVAQVHGQAIELQLAGIGNHRGRLAGLGEQLAHPRIESDRVGLAEPVVQRQHRHGMAHRRQIGAWCSADPQCRRIGRGELRVLSLQGLQLREQAIEFGIRNQRRIQHVIGGVVTLDLGAQLLRAFARAGRGLRGHRAAAALHQTYSRRARSPPGSMPALRMSS